MNFRQHDMWNSFQRRQSFFCRAAIVEYQSRDRVGSDNLRLHSQVADEVCTKAIKIVDEETCASEQQGCATRQSIQPDEFACNGRVPKSRHCVQFPNMVFCDTPTASLSSSELISSPARFAVVAFTWKRT